jgi:hypothetical protein
VEEDGNAGQLNATAPIGGDLRKIGIGDAVDIEETDEEPDGVDRGLVRGEGFAKEPHKKSWVEGRHQE